MADNADAIRTTCPYCGVGCGLRVSENKDGGFVVKGDPDHPANFGKLCSKGAALAETLGDENRLRFPLVDGMRSRWDDALNHVAMTFKNVIREYGPDAVAFYVSGQLMTEAYYVANKLMKGFIGSANIDTNSRLCMSSTVAGHKRAFGSDTVPTTYRDMETADLVVIVGSNMAWCHPVLYRRLVESRKKNGTRVVVIDPRKTATSDIADLYLPIKPGTDVKLFNGLLSHLAAKGIMDWDFTKNHTSGFKHTAMEAYLEGNKMDGVAEICDIPESRVREFFEMFATTEKTVTVFSQGINQSSSGTDKVNAIINVHLMSGRIGKPGQGPLSLTGQPNAMGGREVGGLANTLAAHMDFDAASVDRVKRFWSAPNMAHAPGLKAVDMFAAVKSGRIKALWVMATNPAVSIPHSLNIRQAIRQCPFVVVSDCSTRSDTLKDADVVLPAATWGERDGTVTNSERMISRQRAFKKAPGEARPDWRIICDVAGFMGYQPAFDYQGAGEIFAEHAALSAFENNGDRDFNLSGLTGLTKSGYDGLEPVRWPVAPDAKDRSAPQRRLFQDGVFFTPDQRARFVPVRYAPPPVDVSDAFPLILNTGRVRDQWHTMTRSGSSPMLARHRMEPFVEMHSLDAKRYGLRAGGLALVKSPLAEICVRVRIDNGIRPGTVFTPIHWSDTNTANAVVCKLIPANVDALSGQPELKTTPVSVVAFDPVWSGLVVTRRDVAAPQVDYWTKTAGKGCSLMTLSGSGSPESWQIWAENLVPGQTFDWISYSDDSRSIHRFAAFKQDRLELVVFISKVQDLPDFGWIEQQFSEHSMDAAMRSGVLAGKSADPDMNKGALVCSCFGIGINQLLNAIAREGLISVDDVGRVLKAGTNCGSCRPEIQALLENRQAA